LLLREVFFSSSKIRVCHMAFRILLKLKKLITFNMTL
jgi:hypothetical protein